MTEHGHAVGGELNIRLNGPAAGFMSSAKSRQTIFGRTNTGTTMSDQLKTTVVKFHKYRI